MSKEHEQRIYDRCLVRVGQLEAENAKLLVELLTGRKHHYYDVSDDAGWRRLARDMSCICDMSVDECKSFVADLYSHDLINREQYDELHRVTITRILRDAKTYAETVAMKQLAAWKMNRKKLGR